MPNFTPLISTVDFTPTSFDEYMKPQALAENLYQTRKKFLDDKADILANFLPYLNDSTPEARRLYDEAQAQLDRNVQLLGTKGWNLNPEPIIAFKNQYRKTNAILDKASKDLEELKKQDKDDVAKDNSLFIRYKNNAGQFISPNIDSMISGDYSRHFVSGKEVQANAMADAQRLSSTVKAAFSEFKKHGQYIGYFSSRTGSMQGVPNAVLMDWLTDPSKYTEDINSWLANVKKFGGDHAVQAMKTLFNGEFKKALQSTIDLTDYDNMEKRDQVRLNNYLWTGAYQGMKYDEQLQENGSPYNWEKNPTDKDSNKNKNKDGDEGVYEQEVVPPMVRPQIYRPDESLRMGDDWDLVRKYFNIDDANFNTTGDLSFSNTLALINGDRHFGDELGMREDYTKADKFIKDIENLNTGIMDYFSIFDANGKLPTKAEFKEVNKSKFRQIMSKDYYIKHKDNADYGKSFTDLLHNSGAGSHVGETQGSPNISDEEWFTNNEGSLIYENMEKAILAAYRVPEKERETILKDTTGKEFEKFVKNNNITEASFKNHLIDLADEQANITVQQQQARFVSNNEQIVQNVLQKSQVTDGKDKGTFELRPLSADSYTYKKETIRDDEGKEHKHKVYTIKPGYAKRYTYFDLFHKQGSNDTSTLSYDCVYIIPPTPSQGIILQTSSGQYLIPAEQLGSLYPAQQIASLQKQIDAGDIIQDEAIKEMKDINNKIQKIKDNKDLNEEDKVSQIEELSLAYEQAVEAYKVAQMNKVQPYTEITKLFKNSVSLMYNTNVQ